MRRFTLVEDESRDGGAAAVASAYAVETGNGTGLGDVLAHMSEGWIRIGGLDDGADHGQRLAEAAAQRVGCVELGGAGDFWRREALLGLAESGLIESLDDHAALMRFKPFYVARARPHRAGMRRGLAVLTSRNGADLYGGGEHFLEDAAAHHARQGYDVVILGTRPERAGEAHDANGRRAVFIGEHPAELRRFVLENGASLVHAISGMGFAAVEALAFTNIALVYGVHFWNELLGDPERSEYFDDVSGGALARREFLVILSRATAVYANSRYTQTIVEEGFGVRCPVLYAVPRERA
jgi:hypothetical protein